MNYSRDNLNLSTENVFSVDKKGYVTSSFLVLVSFATTFFPRLLDTLGAPSVVNFVHFIVVPFTCIVVLATSKTKNVRQQQTTTSIIIGLFGLLLANLISAFINQAGAINAILNFMLLAEPFIFLICIAHLPLTAEKFAKLKFWLLKFFWIHLFLVFVQKYILRTDTWEWVGMEGADRIQGVFFISGSGHVVGSSISLTFALYNLICNKKAALWLRYLVVLAALWNIIIADGKQVLLVFIVAVVLLCLVNLNDVVAAFKYVFIGLIICSIFWWCVGNLEAFAAFNTWIRPELYGVDGEATQLKTSAFRIIPIHYESILNWLFGLGPGHSVGRLGGWMLGKYNDLLSPLGSTTHPVSDEVWGAVGSSWLGDQSSMFSPLFGWAGIWGDLGFVGLAAYLYLGFVVWKRVCKNDLSKFLMLTVLIFGCILSQLEEPGYTLSVACIIGIQYQEDLIDRIKKVREVQLRKNYAQNNL